jgi:hypothetical protein
MSFEELMEADPSEWTLADVMALDPEEVHRRANERCAQTDALVAAAEARTDAAERRLAATERRLAAMEEVCALLCGILSDDVLCMHRNCAS